MTESLKALALVLFAWVFIGILLSWLVAALYPALSRLLKSYSAKLRSRLTLALSLAPFAIALSVVFLYANPQWSLLFISTHCHSDICGPHSLHTPVASAGAAGLLILAVLMMSLVLFFIWQQLKKGRRYSSTLAALSEPKADIDFRLIQTPKPAAWCVGLLKPQIYLSQGLIEQVSPEQLQIIFAHEYAHVRRKDNLRKWVLHWSTQAWPHALKNRIQRDFTADIETLCDLAAIKQANKSSKAIAETLGLIEQYCSEQGLPSQNEIDNRVKLLEREIALGQHSNTHKWQDIKLNLMAASFVVLLLIATARLSHPVLEWLLR